MKSKIFVTVNNHFDIMWRRPFLRRFENNGRQFVSYADIERMYILENMRLAEKYPEYKFDIESAMVCDTFLNENPDQRDRLEKLIREGRVTIEGSGYVIIDTNLASGESIIRNYLLEQEWRKEENIDSTPLAVRLDGFGNCSQLPQILRNFHYRWLRGLCYVPCPEPYWKGLDGSVVCVTELPSAGGQNDNIKYEPCPTCHGYGTLLGAVCPDCKGSCIDRNKEKRIRLPLVFSKDFSEPYGSAIIGGEEALPLEEMLFTDLAKLKDRFDIEFAPFEDSYDLLKDKIEAVDSEDLAPDQIHPECDLNPATTGVYVTRIKAKQMTRYFEHQLMANDVLAVLLYLNRKKLTIPDSELWKNIMYMLFHDSVTGTHVDAAYEELKSYWHETDKGLKKQRREMFGNLKSSSQGMSVFNPTGTEYSGIMEIDVLNPDQDITGISDNRYISFLENYTDQLGCRKGRFLVRNLPAYTASSFSLQYGPHAEETVSKPEGDRYLVLTSEEETRNAEAAAAKTLETIRNEYFTITADAHGVVDITDRRTNEKISASGKYRPFEWILTHDDGSPWATLSESQEESSLAPCTKLLKCEKNDQFERLTFSASGNWFMFGASHNTEITFAVTLYSGVERVDCSSDVQWNNYCERLRVVLPLTEKGRHMYEVPYGMQERKPYKPNFYWSGTNGDYAASNWAGVEGEHYSAALFNMGTPSYRILDDENGSVIYMSVLRSPVTPTFLHEELFYTMKEWDGMRDAGAHHFDFALKVYNTGFAENAVMADAESYNSHLLVTPGEIAVPDMPKITQGNAYISSVKLTEDHLAAAVRIIEASGKGQKVHLHVPEQVQHLYKTGMDEKIISEISILGNEAEFDAKPFEIVTLRMEL